MKKNFFSVDFYYSWRQIQMYNLLPLSEPNVKTLSMHYINFNLTFGLIVFDNHMILGDVITFIYFNVFFYQS